jgi:hypothetical protein
MLAETGKGGIALAEEKRLVKVLRAFDVFDVPRTGYRDLVCGRVTPNFSSSFVERTDCFLFQLFFDVTAKNAAGSW